MCVPRARGRQVLVSARGKGAWHEAGEPVVRGRLGAGPAPLRRVVRFALRGAWADGALLRLEML